MRKEKRLEPRFWYALAIAFVGIVVIIAYSGHLLGRYYRGEISENLFVDIAAIIMYTPGMILMLGIILIGLILCGIKRLIHKIFLAK